MTSNSDIREAMPSEVDNFLSSLFAANQSTSSPSSSTEKKTDEQRTEHDFIPLDEAVQQSDQSSSLRDGPENKTKIVTHESGHGTQTHTLTLERPDWTEDVSESQLVIQHVPSSWNNYDLLDIFHPFGKIVEIVIENSIGTIRFQDLASCKRALTGINGKTIRDHRLAVYIKRKEPKKQNSERHNQPNNTRRMKNQRAASRPSPTMTSRPEQVDILVWDRVNYDYCEYVKSACQQSNIPASISLVPNARDKPSKVVTGRMELGARCVLSIQERHTRTHTVDVYIAVPSHSSKVNFQVHNQKSLPEAIQLAQQQLHPKPSYPTPASNQTVDISSLAPEYIDMLASLYDTFYEPLKQTLASKQASVLPVQTPNPMLTPPPPPPQAYQPPPHVYHASYQQPSPLNIPFSNQQLTQILSSLH
ncbi:hypothetical protein DM01DRAFT_1337326 [Hesseltinella vesiculosa]|uniref:RRM domain-containing protein n=1 Tax=Hesseltinella vesiculosa TaxID=101127 RepID=A0A1X2GDI0_9FUNG|nr:hypothetical protein DM01DRAFT_1337326 [Hesseltinella vesiculosa]